MKNYFKKNKKILLFFLFLFLLLNTIFFSIYKTEKVVSLGFKIITKGNIKIEKLSFEKESNYKKGVIKLKNVKLYDSEEVKSVDAPRVEIEYEDLKVKSINVYDPEIIFIRKGDYYNIASVFVDLESPSDNKEEIKNQEEDNSYPLLKKIKVYNAKGTYFDRSYTKEIRMDLEKVNSVIEFFRGYSINIDASANRGKEEFKLNFNTINKNYDFNVIGKNVNMDETILQYAYDSEREIKNVEGKLNIDFRMNDDGFFGSGKVENGKAKYEKISLPISNIELDLKFLGEKIRIDGDYLVGDENEGKFTLNYDQNNGTEVNFDFENVTYEKLLSHKELSKFKFNIKNTLFENININLRYKDKLRTKVFFKSKKGVEKEKYILEDIYGNFVYENEEMRFENVYSTLKVNGFKNLTEKKVLANLTYKEEKGKLKIEFKDSENIFPDLYLGVNFRLNDDEIEFSSDSKLIKIIGKYKYDSRLITLNQEDNFKLKYDLKNNQLIDLKGFLNSEIENKKIKINILNKDNQKIGLECSVKEIENNKEKLKGKITGNIDIEKYLYDFKFEVNDLDLKIKNNLFFFDFNGIIKGEETNYLGEFNIENIDFENLSKEISLKGIYGNFKFENNENLKGIFDGQIKELKYKNLKFLGLRASADYKNNEIKILNLENKNLKLSGKYNFKNTLVDLFAKLNGIDNSFLNFKKYSFSLDDLSIKSYGEIEKLFTEITIKSGKINLYNNLDLNISGKINYSDKIIFSDSLKMDKNILSFKYFVEKKKGNYDLDLFKDDLSKFMKKGKARLIAKIKGEIKEDKITGDFRGTLNDIYYSGKKIPLIYLEGKIKDKFIDFLKISFKNKDRVDILSLDGEINLENKELNFNIPNQNVKIDDILKKYNLTGEIKLGGKIKGTLEKLSYKFISEDGNLEYKDNEIKNLNFLLTGNKKNINLDNFSMEYKNEKINMKGYYNILSDNYNFNLKSPSIDLGFINIFFNKTDLTEIRGIGKVDLNISNIEPRGNIEVKNFGMKVDKYGLNISDLNGNLGIENNKLMINEFSGTLNNGKLNIKGIIEKKDSLKKFFTDYTEDINYNLVLDGRNIDYVYENYFKLNFNTRIQILENKIFGNVTINNGKITNILKKDTGIFQLLKALLKNKNIENKIVKEIDEEKDNSKSLNSEEFKINIGFNVDNGVELDVEEATSYISKLRGKILGQGVLQGSFKKLNFLGETSIKDGGFMLNGNKFTVDKALVFFNNREEYIPDVNPNVLFVTSSIINSKIFEITLSGLSRNLTFKVRSGDDTSVNSLDSILGNGEFNDGKSNNASLLLANILGGQVSDIVIDPLVNVFKEIFRLPKLRISSNIIAEQKINEKEKEEILYGASFEAEMPLYKEKIYGRVKANFMGDAKSDKVKESYGLVNYDLNVYNKINKSISWGVGAQKLRDEIEVKKRDINYYIELKLEKKFDF